MSLEITMPKLSDTMEEGTILSWRIKEGDRVARGDIIAEVETDKAAMEMEAFDAGTVAELRVPAGETVKVGTVLAILTQEGEEAGPSAAAKPEPEARTDILKALALDPNLGTAHSGLGQIALIASVYGASTRSDLYFIASIVPLTIGTVVGEAFATSLLPAFVQPHIHLDKVLTGPLLGPNRTGTLAEAIALSHAVKRAATVEEVRERAGRVIRAAVLAGTAASRAHARVAVDWDALRAELRLRA